MSKTCRGLVLAAAAGLAVSAARAQFTIVNNQPGTFVDISGTGTAAVGVGDDTLHQFTTTVGNLIFPAGTITACSNGWVCAGVASSAPFTNAGIPASGVPSGLTTGTQG